MWLYMGKKEGEAEKLKKLSQYCNWLKDRGMKSEFAYCDLIFCKYLKRQILMETRRIKLCSYTCRLIFKDMEAVLNYLYM